MPIVPLLRTTFLLSSLTLAASYALYESNPQFRAFVDGIVNKITSTLGDIFANLSPEERRRREDEHRREVLQALAARDGEVNLENWRNASGADTNILIPDTTDTTAIGSASGVDVRSGANDNMLSRTSADGNATPDASRARRRNLWEIAERNAAELRKHMAGGPFDRAALRRRISEKSEAVPQIKSEEMSEIKSEDKSEDLTRTTLFEASPHKMSETVDTTGASNTDNMLEPTASTDSVASFASAVEEAADSGSDAAAQDRNQTSVFSQAPYDLVAAPDPDISIPADMDADVSDDGTSTAGSYSHILTPTTESIPASPSMRSVSASSGWGDMSDAASEVDTMSLAGDSSAPSLIDFDSDMEHEVLEESRRARQ